MTAAFIDDGYTLDGYIAESPVHPAVAFVFRPMTRREVTQFNAALSQLPNTPSGIDDGEQKAAETVAAHLRSWNVVDRLNRAVPISPANLLRLQPVLAGRLLDIVRGVAGSDPRPGKTVGTPPFDADAAAGN